MLVKTAFSVVCLATAFAGTQAASLFKREFTAKDITYAGVKPAVATCKDSSQDGNRACGADGHSIWSCKKDGDNFDWVLLKPGDTGCDKKCCTPEQSASKCGNDVVSWQGQAFCPVPVKG